MGGEVTVLDNYPEMLVALSSGRDRIRLVTNGFFANTVADIGRFVGAMEELVAVCEHIEVAVSEDQWHSSPGDRAVKLLDENDLGVELVQTGDLGIDDIIPIGRAWDNGLAPRGTVQCSCERMCNMIITEDGMIGRCPFGYFPWKHFSETIWGDAQEYVWGWRSEKLAEGMNCHLCMETVEAARCREA